MSSPTCERCGAYLKYDAGEQCENCKGVEYTLDQAHALLERILYHWMYGDKDPTLHRDLEVWCRVAGPPTQP